MSRRVGWENLSPYQQHRYEAAGESGKLTGEPFLTPTRVREYYESGGDLGRARGHVRPRPAWAPPKDATTRAKINLNTEADAKALRRWRRSAAAPKWLPKSSVTLSDDVAAILAEIDVNPNRWRKVEVRQTTSGRYTLRVYVSRREYEFVTTLPDWDAVSQLGSLLNDHARLDMARGSERKRLEKQWQSLTGKPVTIAVDIGETDRKSVKTFKIGPIAPPPPSAPRAIPTKENRTMPPVKPPAKKAAAKKAPAKKAAAKKTPAKRKPARTLRDVSAQLLDLQALLAPVTGLDAATLALLNGLVADVEKLIG